MGNTKITNLYIRNNKGVYSYLPKKEGYSIFALQKKIPTIFYLFNFFSS